MLTQKEKAVIFHQLHHNRELLILPNIWDALGALLLESLGYKAVATASASIAYSNGYYDGENIPFADVLATCRRIVNSVNVPVTADIESGYADSDAQLHENILQLLDTGVAGINIEDTNASTHSLNALEVQCHKISLIRKIADGKGIPLFINARTDVYIHDNLFATAEEKLQETVKRGAAYKDAGADGFYPILMTRQAEIEQVVKQVQLPVNIITIPGIPDLDVLQSMGVARLSLGPSFLKVAIRAMKQVAEALKNHQGLETIINNEVTSDYLKALISKSNKEDE
ncbi:MAG TPA: isocitrate lyase/phosphoenolpyruvate mutase family protein [Flavisolibacter sp.]|nr:isocitrate lyase/phosphoenolpyruvate mutase family protein [Flavisolibacter sp.]